MIFLCGGLVLLTVTVCNSMVKFNIWLEHLTRGFLRLWVWCPIKSKMYTGMACAVISITSFIFTQFRLLFTEFIIFTGPNKWRFVSFY